MKNKITHKKQKLQCPKLNIPKLFLDKKLKKNRKISRIHKIKSHRMRFDLKNINEGRWNKNEHQKFVTACFTYGCNWKKVINLYNIFIQISN